MSINCKYEGKLFQNKKGICLNYFVNIESDNTLDKFEPKIKIMINMDKNNGIYGFSGCYMFLSNFYPTKIEYEGLQYNSTEAAYQSAKTLDKQLKLKFVNIIASESKKLGRKLVIRKDWEHVKIDIMYELLLKKFSNQSLKDKLLSTGDKYLEETNYWGDTFWGVSKNKGNNNLGKLLMKVREFYKDNNVNKTLFDY